MKTNVLKIAKFFGWFLIVFHILGFLLSLFYFVESTTPVSLLIIVVGIISGILLVLTKRWGIYSLGLLILLNEYNNIFIKHQYTKIIQSFNVAVTSALNYGPGFVLLPIIISIIGIVLFFLPLYLFFLFFFNKDKFSE